MIIDRIERYSALGIELLILHFHPMLAGMRTFIDRIMPRLPRDRLGNPAAEQAQGPPTNPVEMGLPDMGGYSDPSIDQIGV
jgi:hypothetical protein